MSFLDLLSEAGTWPEIATPLADAKRACERLRRIEGVRRLGHELEMESRIRGAYATAHLAGARGDVEHFRSVVSTSGAWTPTTDPAVQAARGAWLVTTEADAATDVFDNSPLQVLARLHVAAVAAFGSAGRGGRPREAAERTFDYPELGEAPDGALAADRLRALVAGMRTGGVSSIALAACCHAEVAVARPFVEGNGLVARALERVILHARNIDSTGAAVPEQGHLAAGREAYVEGLRGYATGTREGVAAWIRHCAEAVEVAAIEGESVAAVAKSQSGRGEWRRS